MSPRRPVRVLLLATRSGGYERSVLAGVSAYAREVGNWVFLDHHSREATLEMLRSSDFDGVIAHNELPDGALETLGKPVVVLTRTTLRSRLPRVTCDDDKISEAAAQFLLEKGIRHFGYAGLGRSYRSVARRTAFERALGKVLGPAQSVSVCHGAKLGAGRRSDLGQICKWIEFLPKPAGVFCFNDNIAAEVISAVGATDYAIPDDLLVLGVDNDEAIADFTQVRLSSVDPNADEIGYRAARLLGHLVQANSSGTPPKATLDLVPPLGVVERESTDVCRSGDSAIAAALQHIRDSPNEAWPDVSEVVAASGVSRATLFRRFKQTLGRTVYQEIDRQRLLRVRDYIVNTDLPLSRVSVLCGFRDGSALSNYVTKRLGQTPTSLRRLSPKHARFAAD